MEKHLSSRRKSTRLPITSMFHSCSSRNVVDDPVVQVVHVPQVQIVGKIHEIPKIQMDLGTQTSESLDTAPVRQVAQAEVVEAIEIGAKTIDLEWVQVHPAGLVKPDDPDAQIKFLAAEALHGVRGLVFDAHGNRFANELGGRNCVTREIWNNNPPFRLALNKATSDDIAWQCKHYTGRGVMKLHESGTALAEGMGVPVSKMPDSIEAFCQASLKTSKDLDGGSYPSYPSGKSWYEASGKTGSGKKFYHNVISGADFTAPFLENPPVVVEYIQHVPVTRSRMHMPLPLSSTRLWSQLSRVQRQLWPTRRPRSSGYSSRGVFTDASRSVLPTIPRDRV